MTGLEATFKQACDGGLSAKDAVRRILETNFDADTNELVRISGLKLLDVGRIKGWVSRKRTGQKKRQQIPPPPIVRARETEAPTPSKLDDNDFPVDQSLMANSYVRSMFEKQGYSGFPPPFYPMQQPPRQLQGIVSKQCPPSGYVSLEDTRRLVEEAKKENKLESVEKGISDLRRDLPRMIRQNAPRRGERVEVYGFVDAEGNPCVRAKATGVKRLS